MARNLRAKIPESDSLFIQDVNEEAVNSFMAEVGGTKTEAMPDVRQVAERSVSPDRSQISDPCSMSCDETVFPKPMI